MNRRLLCLAACLVLAPAALLAQITGTLSGKVTDDDGKSVAGATIRVGGTNQGGISKPDGKFLINGIRAGDYEITVTGVGYQPFKRSVRISVDQVTEMKVTLTTKAVVGKEITVSAKKDVIVPEQTGTVRKVDGDALAKGSRTSVIDAVALTSSVNTTGQNGFGIRGGRASETSVRVDGVSVGDPFTGGFGSTSARYYPTVSALAVQEVQVIASSFDAQYGDVLSGVVNSVTKSGRNDRYEGSIRFRTQVPALYGMSDAITVKKAGTVQDTTLPGLEVNGSGRQLFDVAFGGPITDGLTFFITGAYQPVDFTGANYKVFDMTPEYANSRRAIAEQLWGKGKALSPTDLGHLPNQSARIYNFNTKLKYNLSNSIFLELGGETGLTTREGGDWGSYYKTDNPVFFRDSSNGVARFDTNTALVEGDWQSGDENTIINRVLARYFHTLDEASFLEVTGSYVMNKYRFGRKDETKSYGFFSSFDIPDPVDADRNNAIDDYELPSQEIILNPFNPESFSSFRRNSITGFYEGEEAPGASRNPYGLADGNFPVHGADGGIEQRESNTFTFTGKYETFVDLSDIRTLVKVGGDFSYYTLRRYSNQNPYDQNPFFDIYGYESPLLSSKDTTGRIADYLKNPYNPWKGSFYLSTQFSYKSIVLTPGVRFDFMNPNTQSAPPRRGTPGDVIASLDSVGDASMKFQVSPRVGVSYPITDASQFRVNFAMMFKMPDFNLLYDNAYGDAIRGNQIFGNPDIDPQKVFNYEMGYTAQIDGNYTIDISAFYRDIYNQTGVTYVPAVPSPYFLYSVQEYGNVRGVELQAGGNLVDNLSFSLNYTLQKAVGTASSPGSNYGIQQSVDPYTGQQRKAPLFEFPLSYDQTHKLNVQLTANWGNDAGPSIGGIYPLENAYIQFTTVFGSGLPYTRTNTKGEQLGQFNSERYPSSFNTDIHIEKGFKLGDWFGEGFGSSEISFFADIFNVLNNTAAVSYYATTGSPDNNGTSLNRQLGDFTAFTFFRDIDPARPETFSANQYDRYGQRLYNPYGDTNLDGVVTQLEKYEGYQRLVSTVQSFRNNYAAPRTIAVGVRLTF
ncbi:MAG: hypothetical protein DYG96_02230 [Chlorobi bacterium CHB2]|nr:hypothetical protein [Chlorobi bacterium CHB2]